MEKTSHFFLAPLFFLHFIFFLSIQLHARTAKLIHFFEAAQSHSLPPILSLQSGSSVFPADTLNCYGQVTLFFSSHDTCMATLRAALDLHIEDLNEDNQLTSADFLADETNANAYLSQTDRIYSFIGDFPIGTHALQLAWEDGCGELQTDLLLYEVADMTGPRPKCINETAVNLLPTAPWTDADGDGDLDNGAALVYAKNLVSTPIYDCNGQGPEMDTVGKTVITHYSINLEGQPIQPEKETVIVTCDDIGTKRIEIHAWDEKGNRSTCISSLLIQDVNCRCYHCHHLEITGVIETEEEESIPNVEVSLTGPLNRTDTTQTDGYFRFGFLHEGDYSVTPSLNANFLDGVSTLDIILIHKHILHAERLSSPHKYIAADVNNDGSISTLDLIELRRTILGIQTGFNNNKSWRFVAGHYEFPFPDNPWFEPFPEVINFNDLIQTVHINFIGIKIGDVSGSAPLR